MKIFRKQDLLSYSYHKLYRKDYPTGVIKLGSQTPKVILSYSVFTKHIMPRALWKGL